MRLNRSRKTVIADSENLFIPDCICNNLIHQLSIPRHERGLFLSAAYFVPFFPVSGFTLPLVDQLLVLVLSFVERSCGVT